MILYKTRIRLIAIITILLTVFTVSAVEKRGHISPQTDEKELKLRAVFKGGDVPTNITTVLRLLKENGILKLKTLEAKKNQPLGKVFVDFLDLDSTSEALDKFACELNEQFCGEEVKINDKVIIPDVEIDPFKTPVKYHPLYDKEAIEKTRQTWSGYIEEKINSPELVMLEVRSFEMEVKTDSSEHLQQAVKLIQSVSSPHIQIASLKKISDLKKPYVFSVLIEGGLIGDDAAMILKALLELNLIEKKEYTVKDEENYFDPLISKLIGVPSTEPIRTLIKELSGNEFSPERIQKNQKFFYPGIKFQSYIWTQILNKKSDADAILLKNIQANWKHLIKEQKPLTETQIEFQLFGFKVNVDAKSPEGLVKAKSKLSEIRSKNIILSFPRTDTKKAVFSSDNPTPKIIGVRDFMDFCTSQKIDKGTEGYIGTILGLERVPESVKKCAPNCPEVIIIDQDIDMHPDIAGAFEDDEGSPIIVPPLIDESDKVQKITVNNQPDKWADHGTHLAGIIGSRENGFGLIGINPQVKMRGFSFAKLDADPVEFAGIITDYRASIFVFASHWTVNQKRDVSIPLSDRKPLSDGKERFEDIVIKRIAGNCGLWIVAAGQANPEDTGRVEQVWDTAQDIDILNRNLTPMNLGDQDNVIVVTNCKDCTSQKIKTTVPSLTPGAFYSTRHLVHLAVTDEKIPSTIKGESYAEMGGTSQAAAIVGGVASIMIYSWPEYYLNRPENVKSRLQATALPLFDGTDAQKITSGVLDAQTAIMDPRQDYIKRGASLEPFRPKKWTTSNLAYIDVNAGQQRFIPTRTIIRLYQLKNRYWIIYTTGSHLGEVDRIGPCQIPAIETSLQLRDGTIASSFSDLLLSEAFRTRQPKQPGN
jgi:hypothetical protein